MNVMSERTMTNSARPNLDASLAEAYENDPYPRNPRLRRPYYKNGNILEFINKRAVSDGRKLQLVSDIR